MRVFAAGSVEDSVMLMDQITKRHRGFGFVTFTCEESVDLVVNLGPRCWVVKLAG